MAVAGEKLPGISDQFSMQFSSIDMALDCSDFPILLGDIHFRSSNTSHMATFANGVNVIFARVVVN